MTQKQKRPMLWLGDHLARRFARKHMTDIPCMNEVFDFSEQSLCPNIQLAPLLER
jgi:hypothetical protein